MKKIKDAGFYLIGRITAFKDDAFAIDWLLKNHFDFLELIQKGLAIEVTEENNPYKN